METWKDIRDYEGFYQVSNSGRVRSLARYIEYKGGKKFIDYKIKTPLNNSWGYTFVTLHNKTRKGHLIHRLVAQAFIPNPNGKKLVNHIDGDKKNNAVENLEWCTNQENIIHAYQSGLKKPTRKLGVSSASCKKIIDTATGKVFYSIGEAARQSGISRSTLTCQLLGVFHNKTTLRYA